MKYLLFLDYIPNVNVLKRLVIKNSESQDTTVFNIYLIIIYLSSIITPFIKIQSVILVFGLIVHLEPIVLFFMDVFSIILVFGPTKQVSLSNWLDEISASGEILSSFSSKSVFNFLIYEKI